MIDLTTLDLLDARVLRYRYTVARKHMPGFLDVWCESEGGITHLKFSEVRGFLDLGVCGQPLEELKELQRSAFAAEIVPTPVFEKARPGRLFAWHGARNERGRLPELGEVIAAEARVADEAVPGESGIAAPIPWAQAEPLLMTLRVLGVQGWISEGGPIVEVRLGAPRGEYAIRATGTVRLEERGYPGDRGLNEIRYTDRLEGGMVELIPGGGMKAVKAPMSLEGTKIVVGKVVGVE